MKAQETYVGLTSFLLTLTSLLHPLNGIPSQMLSIPFTGGLTLGSPYLLSWPRWRVHHWPWTSALCQNMSWDAVLGLDSELPHWIQGHSFQNWVSWSPIPGCSQLCPPLPVWWILRPVFYFPGKYLELGTNLHSISPENSFYNSALWTLLQIPRNQLKSNQLIHVILPGWQGRTVQIRPGEKSVLQVRYITCQCRRLFLLLTD